VQEIGEVLSYVLEPMSPGQLGDSYRMQLAPQGIRWIWRPQFPPSWGRFPFERAATRRPHVVGVPVLRSCETAVTNCAGAKGLVRRMLSGTPFAAHLSALAAVM
jgi:hypothetical protein